MLRSIVRLACIYHAESRRTLYEEMQYQVWRNDYDGTVSTGEQRILEMESIIAMGIVPLKLREMHFRLCYTGSAVKTFEMN